MLFENNITSLNMFLLNTNRNEFTQWLFSLLHYSRFHMYLSNE